MVAIESLSLRDLLKNLRSNKILLPTLQRSFVWTEEQIEKLFDSIYKDYPMGALFIWETTWKEIKESNLRKFVGFLRFYNPYLEELNLINFEDMKQTRYYIVLDGQQRLTALNIGLRGLMGEKAAGRATWVEWKGLFINLLSDPKSGSVFKFIPIFDEEIKKNPQSFWSKCFVKRGKRQGKSVDMRKKNLYAECKELLQNMFDTKEGRKEFMNDLYPRIFEKRCKISGKGRKLWFPVWILYEELEGLCNSQNANDENRLIEDLLDAVGRILKSSLKDVEEDELKQLSKKIKANLKPFVHNFADYRINYYSITEKDPVRIFDIFNRVNTGGTQLSYADIIFGFVASSWEGARKEFTEILNRINEKIGGTRRDGFSIDFLIRTALMLYGKDVSPKVESILKKPDFIEYVKKNWGKIKEAIESSVEFISGFGITNRDMPSKNAIIPLIYLAYNNADYLEVLKKPESDIGLTKEILKYFFASVLRKAFSSHGDELLEKLRDIIKERFLSTGEIFEFKKLAEELLKERDLGKNLFINFYELEDEESQIYTGIALKAVWIFQEIEERKEMKRFAGLVRGLEVDHIFPKSKFSKERKEVSEAVDKFIECFFGPKGDEPCSEARELFRTFYEENRYEFDDELANFLNEFYEVPNLPGDFEKSFKEKFSTWLKDKIVNDWVDRLPNKMLLREKRNRSKKGGKLETFLNRLGKRARNELLEGNVLPPPDYYKDFADFVFFYLKRYQLLRDVFSKIFSESSSDA